MRFECRQSSQRPASTAATPPVYHQPVNDARGARSRATGRWLGLSAGALVAAVLLHACGSRTGLLPGELLPDAATDVTVRDAPAEVLTPSCRPRTCASAGYKCGTNGDGCGHAIECGDCPVPESCGVPGYSICGGGFGLGPDGGPLCKPKTCLDLGLDCGPAADGCGGTLQCGICQFPLRVRRRGRPRPVRQPPALHQPLPPAGGVRQRHDDDHRHRRRRHAPPVRHARSHLQRHRLRARTGPCCPSRAGVQCSQCGGEVSGNPLVATQTAPDGTFTLGNVPVGADIPLVIQLGRWRRQLTIPSVAACTTTALPPSPHAHAAQPHRGRHPAHRDRHRRGRRDRVRAPEDGHRPGRVHATRAAAGACRCTCTTARGSDPARRPPRSCGAARRPSRPTTWWSCRARARRSPSSPTDQQNLIEYTSAGGRVFATHYSYTWLDDVAPFSGTATWSVPGDPNAPDTLVGTIDTSFLEGQSFATWLQGVGALSGPDQISLTSVRDDVVGVVAPTSRFIYAPSAGAPVRVLHAGGQRRLEAVRARRLHRLPRQRRREHRRRRALERHDVPHRVHPLPDDAAGEGARVHAVRPRLVRPAPAPELHAAHVPAAEDQLRPRGRRLRRPPHVRHVPRQADVRRRRRLRPVRLPRRGHLHPEDLRRARLRLRRQRRRLRQRDPLRQLQGAADLRRRRASRACAGRSFRARARARSRGRDAGVGSRTPSPPRRRAAA